ncbi:MAG TPA: D-alanyl-D-alanine carboxypeptidase [Pyrinomonadaceae bacterium]|nr:D-alanyl-D-alanine carboxypeptidase [Pyrinomonadaceae bacterium]
MLKLNRRGPILWMIAAGLIVVAVLTYIPHHIRARSAVTSAVALISETNQLEDQAARREESAQPSFDAAAWFLAHEESPETHGVLIETLDGSRILASLNADVTFNPASLVKLSTSLVALSKLGKDFRFQTRVFLASDSKGAAEGKLYVRGNDPTFGDAGAALIAKELEARGVKRLSEIVVQPGFNFNFSDKAEESATRLAKVLKLGNPKTSVADEAGGQVLVVVNSNPLSDVLLYMNARSSNFMADKIGALIGGAEGVRQFLIDELKLSGEYLTLATVSGREHNRMTARDVLEVIRALIAEAGRQGLEPADIMPVASDDTGTLRRRLAGTGLEGAVVAKTGTLTAEVDGGMTSLAGIVYTEDQGPILFAILAQGNRIWDNRQMEDALLAEVINAHARPRVVAGPTPRRLLPATNVSTSSE